MRVFKRRLVHLPSDVVNIAFYKQVEPTSDYYTLSYIPEEGRVSIEQTKGREPYSLKDFLVVIENTVTDDQQNLQPGRTCTVFNTIHPKYRPRFQKWKDRMRKAKVLQIIPGSTDAMIKTVPVYSPMERQVIQLKNPMDHVHTLHLQPFQSKSSTSTKNCISSKSYHSSKSSHSFRSGKPFDESKFDNMTAKEVHDYFNQKAAETMRAGRAGGGKPFGRGVNPSTFMSETVYGKEIAENPDSEEYDTDSEIEKQDDKQ